MAAVAAQLRTDGFAALQLPAADRQVAIDFQAQLESLFGLGEAGLSSLPGMRMVDGLLVGYRESDQRDFIEMRLRYPEAVPDPSPPIPGFAEAVAAMFQVLMRVGRGLLAAIARDLGADPAVFLDVVDAGQPGLTASALRLCKYDAVGQCEWSCEEGPQGSDVEADGAVAFGAHTDSCFVTLASCSAVPGVQIQQADGSWVMPERGQDCTQVVVFAGEILQALSKNRYKATVHRVLRPVGELPRLSMPFLMRGRSDACIDTGGAEGLLPLKDYSMKTLHKFLELRRRRNMQLETNQLTHNQSGDS